VAKETIGYVKCSECGEPQAAVRMSSRSFAYSVCPNCGKQGFCRSKMCSDSLLNRMQPIEQAAPRNDKPEEVKDHGGFFE